MVDAPDSSGKTPLQWASSNGRLAAMEFLVAKGADVNSVSGHQYTILHTVAETGSLSESLRRDVIAFLVEKGAEPSRRKASGQTVFDSPASAGHIEAMEYLCSRGYKVTTRSRDGLTPLHLAAASGQSRSVKWLLGKGAEVNARTSDGATPLHKAAAAGKLEITQVLVEAGADPALKTSRGETPVDLAGRKGHGRVEKYLQSLPGAKR